jgi:hypothetical protein
VRTGDLVEVCGYDRNGDIDHDRVVGVLMGWDHSDEGWIVLIDGQLQVYPKTWWRCRRA